MDTTSKASKKKYLFRIVSIEQLIRLFKKEELKFSNPNNWEDPYEIQLKNDVFSRTFASCWCKHSVSDAMWRIYSPNKLGIRIKTTRDILVAQMKKSLMDRNDKIWKIQNVLYKNQSEIDKRNNNIEAGLKKNTNPPRILSTLFWKRKAFSHEAEVRVGIFDKRERPDKELFVKIDPHVLILSILIDPRAPKEVVDLYTYYFKNELKFKNRIAQSELYAKRPNDPKSE